MKVAQDKLELAVLWCVANGKASPFADPETIATTLKQAGTETRIRAALHFLTEKEMLRDCSAVSQEHFEPTRKGIQLVERLEANKHTYVARLDKNGADWIFSEEAKNAKIDVIWNKKAKSEDRKGDGTVGPITSNIPISVNVSPTFNNSLNNPVPTSPTNSNNGADRKAGSARIGTWFGAWGTWVGVALAIVALYVTLSLAGKI